MVKGNAPCVAELKSLQAICRSDFGTRVIVESYLELCRAFEIRSRNSSSEISEMRKILRGVVSPL